MLQRGKYGTKWDNATDLFMAETKEAVKCVANKSFTGSGWKRERKSGMAVFRVRTFQASFSMERKQPKPIGISLLSHFVYSTTLLSSLFSTRWLCAGWEQLSFRCLHLICGVFFEYSGCLTGFSPQGILYQRSQHKSFHPLKVHDAITNNHIHAAIGNAETILFFFDWMRHFLWFIWTRAHALVLCAMDGVWWNDSHKQTYSPPPALPSPSAPLDNVSNCWFSADWLFRLGLHRMDSRSF